MSGWKNGRLVLLALPVLLAACSGGGSSQTLGGASPSASSVLGFATASPTGHPTHLAASASATKAATTAPPSAVSTHRSPPAMTTHHPTAHPTNPAKPSPPSAPVFVITAMDYSFSPSSPSVRVGTTVKVVNKGPSSHTWTSGTAGVSSGTFDSGNLDPNHSYQYHFGKAGTYNFFCQYHYATNNMKGKITVM